MTSQSGAVYALDPATGCTHSTYKAQSARARAVSVGPDRPANAPTGYAICIPRMPSARVRRRRRDGQGALGPQGRRASRRARTGAPTLHAGRLYVVTSGVSEETAASMPAYERCTFRGSLTSLDATTGEVVWRTYTVDEPQQRGNRARAASRCGTRRIADLERADDRREARPDPTRRPATRTRILRRARATRSSHSRSRQGRIRWVNQIMPDVWILGCGAPLGGGDAITAEDNPNCPRRRARPSTSASPISSRCRTAATRSSSRRNRRRLPADPERRGREILEMPLGRGSPVGARWRERRCDAREFRRRRSARRRRGGLARRRSRNRAASSVHAAAGAASAHRDKAVARRNPRRYVDSRCRVLGRRRRRRARLLRRRRPGPLDVRHEPRFHVGQRRQSQRRLDRRTGPVVAAEWST